MEDRKEVASLFLSLSLFLFRCILCGLCFGVCFPGKPRKRKEERQICFISFIFAVVLVLLKVKSKRRK